LSVHCYSQGLFDTSVTLLYYLFHWNQATSSDNVYLVITWIIFCSIQYSLHTLHTLI